MDQMKRPSRAAMAFAAFAASLQARSQGRMDPTAALEMMASRAKAQRAARLGRASVAVRDLSSRNKYSGAALRDIRAKNGVGRPPGKGNPAVAADVNACSAKWLARRADRAA